MESSKCVVPLWWRMGVLPSPELGAHKKLGSRSSATLIYYKERSHKRLHNSQHNGDSVSLTFVDADSQFQFFWKCSTTRSGSCFGSIRSSIVIKGLALDST